MHERQLVMGQITSAINMTEYTHIQSRNFGIKYFVFYLYGYEKDWISYWLINFLC